MNVIHQKNMKIYKQNTYGTSIIHDCMMNTIEKE